ncbi:MAG: UDP-N-acetylmuramoyl-L-alanyl-D-glutamate--2,6-diaminopimelate ligase [Muribaculaceae bacterium]|nr:UDP-N-acetylmuramoyl-L-alanyl-D-glutamate--2,6-diaminopimelate ligase [Muribaculaceae bacterium]
MKVKSLKQLIKDIDVQNIVGDITKSISDVTCDSRTVKEGSLFVAVRGVSVDAHQFLPQVAQAGAAAVVCEEIPAEPHESVTYVQVPNSTVALAYLASEWYDNPSSKLKLVGVTGTNGKTTTATLLYELANLMGYKAGLLSTVRNIIDKRVEPAKQTTPDHLTLNRLLSDMVEAGCDYAFMEVSSHACVQHRVDGLKFAGGIFTNLTRDHLDYHGTVDNYINAKKMFFDSLDNEAFAIINIDDKVGKVMVQNTKASVYTYSLRSLADFKCRVIEDRLDGTTLTINDTEVNVLFTGRFNAYNLTSVYAAAINLGWDKEQVLVKMSQLVPVAGRFQTMRSPRGYTAIVDYAHTPDALVNVLDAANEVMNGRGTLITVCGCGGNRDKGKRPIMAKEAALRSGKLILTSDNPRYEDPDAILRDMEVGLPDDKRSTTLMITDRRQAIKTACQLAQAGDVVIVAGKGHEDYQEICGVKHHFDDSEVIAEIFDSEK